MTEATLARAKAGDGAAFGELVDPYRRELQAHCYRILGSVQDAEDVLQEALLAAWRSIGRFDGQSLRAWLYRIATNRCLNYLRGESRRPQPAGLPDQGAGWAGLVRSGGAWGLEAPPGDLAGLPPAGGRHAGLVPGPPAEAAIVDRFVSAFERFDLDELVALLTDDARLTMPPEPAEHRGPQSIAGFLLESHSGQDLKFYPTRANGQPAFVLYVPDPCAPIWRVCGLIVFTVLGSQVRAITRFSDLVVAALFWFPRT